VSLTLTPVLNVYMTKKVHKPSKFYVKSEPFFVGMETGYSRMLVWVMKHKWTAVAGIVVCFAVIGVIGSTLQSELAPLEDKNRFRIAASAPEGTSYDAMETYMNGIVDMMIDSVPERDVILSVTAPGFTGSGAVNTGFSMIKLKDGAERERSQDQIVQAVNRNLQQFNFGKAFAMQAQATSV